VNNPVHPGWWPARQLRARPLREIIACGRQTNPPLYSHVVNFPRLEIPLRGAYKNQIERGGKICEVTLTPGMAMFAGANCWNLPEWRPGLELLSVFFGRTQLAINLVSARKKTFPKLATQKFSLPNPVTGPVPHLLNALEELLQTEGEIRAPLAETVRALMHCVENVLCQPAAPSAGRAQMLLEEIRVFLQSHHQYEITRDSVAAHFNITPNHLSRLFQTHGHITFNAYLTSVRIERAKYLLRNYNLKLDDITVRCGYHDTPYFCHVFKKITSSTPVNYRLKIRHARPR
jgi:AraC-like DNA-binding protein